jgi:hypothetical protein
MRVNSPHKVKEIERARNKYKIKLRDFQQVVWESKKLIEPDTDLEIIQSIVETLGDQMQDMQLKQGALEGKVD